MKMLKEIPLRILGLILFVSIVNLGYAQDDDGSGGGPVTVSFSGPTSVIRNDYDWYNVSVSGGSHTTTYTVSGGTITSQNNNSVYVRWTSSGTSRWIRARVLAGGQTHNKYVYVAVRPPTPPTPSVSGNNCGIKTVTRSSFSSSYNETWYWQTSSGGTSTSNSSSSYTKTSSGTVYLRARSNSGGYWSAARAKSVTVKPYPSLASGSNKSRCGTGSVTLTASPGSNGNTIRWYSSSSGGSVLRTGTSYTTPSLSSSKTYYAASYNSSTGCQDSDRKAITAVINPLPNAYSVQGGGGYCSGGSGVAVTLSDTQTGVRYQLKRGGTNVGSYKNGTNGSISFGNQTTAGTYTVVATNASTGCVRTMSGSKTVTVNALPTVYSVQGGGTYCSGGSGVVITLSNSQTGVNYQMKRNGTNIGGLASGSTGSSINFGNQTTAGTYTVVATNASTSCVRTMSGSQEVDIDPLTVSGTVSSSISSQCGAGSVNFSIAGYTGTIKYWQSRYKNGSGSYTAWTTFEQTDNTTSVDHYLDQWTDGVRTYQVRARVQNGVCTSLYPRKTVTINPEPAVYSVTGGGNYCSGSNGSSIGLSGSQLNVNYELKLGGTVIETVVGTGSPISFSDQGAVGTYSVSATNVPGCTMDMTGSAVINVDVLPLTFTMNGGGQYCEGGSGLSIGLDNSETGIEYQLMKGTTPVGGTVTGTGASLDFGLQTSEDTYTIEAINLTTGCTLPMTGSIDITIDQPTVAGTVTQSTSSLCGSGTANFSISGHTGTILKWQYRYKDGTGPYSSWITFEETDNVTSVDYAMDLWAGGVRTYHIRAKVQSGTCLQKHASKTVTVNPEPVEYAVIGGGSYCVGGSGIAITLIGSQTEVDYQLKKDGTNVGVAISGTGNPISFGNQTEGGTYTVLATSTSTTCAMEMSGSANVLIDNLPTAFTTNGGGNYCEGGTGLTIGLDGSKTGISYQLKLEGTNVGSPVGGTGSGIDFGAQTTEGTYTVEATNTTTGCIDLMSGSESISIDLPTVAGTVSSSVSSMCGPGTVSFSVSGHLGTVLRWRWRHKDGTGDYTTWNTFEETSDLTTVSPNLDEWPGGERTYQVIAVVKNGACTTEWPGKTVVVQVLPGIPVITPPTYGYEGATITRGNPPGDETWYWQSSDTGEDESTMATSILASESGTYYLRAKKDNGCWGTAVSAIIEASEPTSITATTLSNESILVSWTGTAGSDSYRISRSTSPEGIFSEIHVAAAGETEYQDNYLSTGTSYYYRVQSMANGQLSTGLQIESATTNLEFNGNQDQLHKPVLNGNISAIRWKGYNDDAEQLFTYHYDQLNRLKKAQYASKADPLYGNQKGLYSVPSIKYDLNGNITNLTRQGMNLSDNNDIIDELTYDYGTGVAQSNQLLGVRDLRGDAGFKDGNEGADYLYDANGNMRKDLNKGITDITYNHLNLPERVDFDNGTYITYLYDAAGIKLQKIVYDATDNSMKTTDYVGTHIYEDKHDGQGPHLQLVQHEEGRLIYDDHKNVWDYQYHLKDHLGNTRLTFSTTPDEYPMVATMEDNLEAEDYDPWIPSQRNGLSTVGNVSDYVMRLNTDVAGDGSSIEGVVGLKVMFGVQKGDILDASVKSYYEYSHTQDGFFAGAELFNMLLTGSTGSSAGGTEGNSVDASNLNGDILQTIQGEKNAGADSNVPRAYLNYMIFTADTTYKNGGFTQITNASSLSWETVTIGQQILIEEEGFIMFYVSNETNALSVVDFDDLTITHTKTNIVQSDDYYPFGLTFNGYQRTASTVNSFKYNGKELDENTGWMDYGARRYMADIGRWTVADAVSDLMPNWTPYRYAYNNPLRYIDPDGNTEEERVKAIARAWEFVNANPNQSKNLYGYPGWRVGTPGFRTDCSNMVSACAAHSGFGHLNNEVDPTFNGVRNIIGQSTTRSIDDNAIRDGDIFTVAESSHTGFVTNIVRNEDGKIVGFTILHSRGGRGPIAQVINLLDKEDKYAQKYFANGKASFFAWDTPDEDEPGFSGPKRSKVRFDFQQLVNLTLSQKSKEERDKDFWDLQSLRLDNLMKQWNAQFFGSE
ncbi:MAG: RHS repeat-associated core domain-containing protein [Cyclobacteriaceae bacterium]